ncbi:putative nucleotidyltransferase, ribonuclease H [Tanacetum coccineum]
MLIDHEYVNCPLRFDDRIRPANLLPIHMLDFDVILGMDWCFLHRATIDLLSRLTTLILKGAKVIPRTSWLSSAREIECGIELIPQVAFLGPYDICKNGILWIHQRFEAITKWRDHNGDGADEKGESLCGRMSVRRVFEELKTEIGCLLRYCSSISFWWFSISMKPSKKRYENKSNHMLQIKKLKGTPVSLWLLVQNVEDGKHTSSVDDDDVVCSTICKEIETILWWTHEARCGSVLYPMYDLSCRSKLNIRGYGLLQPLKIPVWKWIEIPWISLLKLGTRLKFSTTFHPQTDGQSGENHSDLGRNVLRACALEWTGSWDEYLCLVEFAYNNSWHASIKATPFELLYGKKEKLKEARSRQKSYADKHRRDLEFQVGDRVFLKVSPFRGVKRFGIKGKLSPRFIGPFEFWNVLERFRTSGSSSRIIRTFMMSFMYSFEGIPLFIHGHVASYPFDQFQLICIFVLKPESHSGSARRVMRNKVHCFLKFSGKNHPERELPGRPKSPRRASYPHFFV